MSKEIQNRNTYLVCSCCSRPKNLYAFTLPWQKKKNICNYCREFRPFNNVVVNRVKQVDKLVSCLRCDRTFKGRNNVRICNSCKDTEAYKDDCLYEFFTVGATA